MNAKLFYMLVVVITTFYIGCGNKEIKELKSTVGVLENRLEDYQESTTTGTKETNTALGSINQALNNRFLQIQNAQSNLENTLQQVANRLSELERASSQIQQRNGRLEEFTTETATLTQDLNRTALTLQNSLTSETKDLRQQMESLSGSISSLQSESRRGDQDAVSRIQTAQSALDQRITQIETNNRTIYEKILKELGGSVPASVQPSQPTTLGSGEYTVHVVVSGDSLSKIASKYGVEMSALQEVNGITDPSHINLGQEIKIPK
ncbi:MAG: LysM peptidoglycan-binding domain-containing protein [Candidatus Hinthialibacter antarcticus]|nr:LysM peptidoglycan-binding domain-containing protein [Candidatus Hinthialibacter antarcticus]